jgi:hypothetical protein
MHARRCYILCCAVSNNSNYIAKSLIFMLCLSVDGIVYCCVCYAMLCYALQSTAATEEDAQDEQVGVYLNIDTI